MSPTWPPSSAHTAQSFVAWINHHLRTRGIATVVTNLEDALEDGLLLIDLIEHLSGQKLATPVRKPTLRVQKLNNLAIAFKQLKREIHMVRADPRAQMSDLLQENIAPEDIADRNVKIVMGLVWSLILRYQIASLEGSIKSGAQRPISADLTPQVRLTKSSGRR